MRKKLFNAIVVAALTVCMTLTAINQSSVVTIVDDSSPLAAQPENSVKAYFYLDTAGNATGSFNRSNYKYVGSGYISAEVQKVESANVGESVLVEPNYNKYVSDGSEIRWNMITYSMKKWMLVGYEVSTSSETDDSSSLLDEEGVSELNPSSDNSVTDTSASSNDNTDSSDDIGKPADTNASDEIKPVISADTGMVPSTPPVDVPDVGPAPDNSNVQVDNSESVVDSANDSTQASSNEDDASAAVAPPVDDVSDVNNDELLDVADSDSTEQESEDEDQTSAETETSDVPVIPDVPETNGDNPNLEETKTEELPETEPEVPKTVIDISNYSEYASGGDWSVALNMAEAEAASLGLKVYFPAGEYKLCSHVTKLGGVDWFGENNSSVIIVDDSFVSETPAGINFVITNSGAGGGAADGFTISHLAFRNETSESTNVTGLFYFMNTNGVTIDSIYAETPSGMSNEKFRFFDFNGANSNTIISNNVLSGINAVLMFRNTSSSESQGLTITNNKLNRPTYEVIWVCADVAPISDVVVADNYINGARAASLKGIYAKKNDTRTNGVKLLNNATIVNSSKSLSLDAYNFNGFCISVP